MAAESGQPPFLVELTENPYAFDFFAAVRRLEALFADRPRFGTSDRLREDPIRFSQEPSMSFAASSLASFDRGAGAFPPKLSVLFFGLFGTNGPLPLHLTQLARQRLGAGDSSLTAFADMFHHRLLSLFYRAWADAQPTVGLDRPNDDAFSNFAGSLIGIGMPSFRNRDHVSDYAKLFFAGHFSRGTRNADGLAAILEGFFELPARIEQFVGHWIEIPECERWIMGCSGPSLALGRDAVLGARVWDSCQRFRIVLGPVNRGRFEGLLPRRRGAGSSERDEPEPRVRSARRGESLDRLVDIVRNYVGDEFDWDVRVLVEGAPSVVLGEAGEIGWTSWLGTPKQDDAAGDVVLRPVATPLGERLEPVPS